MQHTNSRGDIVYNYTYRGCECVRDGVAEFIVEPRRRGEWQAPETFTPGFPPRKLAFYAPPPFFYDSYIIIRPLNALCFVCCVSVCVFSAAIGFRTQKEQTNRLICRVGV